MFYSPDARNNKNNKTKQTKISLEVTCTCTSFKHETVNYGVPFCISLHLYFTAQSKTLIQTLRLSHRTLDIERSHVLPVLLQKGDQEIDGKIDICHKFFVAHINMANGHSKAENLKFNNESTNLLYKISWLPEIIGLFHSLQSTCTPGRFPQM